MGFQFLPLLLFSLYLFACWDRYAGQMPREMWCIVHSSYSLGFPWWEVRSRSWNVIPKLFKIYTYAREDSVLMMLALCLHVCVCSGKQPTATVLSSFLTSRWSIPGRTVLLASWPHWGTTACHSNGALSWAFISNPHHQGLQYRGTISITSKPKLWLTSTRSTCLLMTPITCSCKLIICGRSDVQPLRFVGGDSLQAE